MKSGEEAAALERLMSEREWLQALARRLVDGGQEADELVQDTWLAALRRPPDPARAPRPWLATVLRRLASRSVRAAARRREHEERAARPEGRGSDWIERLDTQRALAEVVLSLPEPRRTTLVLRYFEQLEVAEIARRQGVAEATVRTRLSRALAELRERLDAESGGREEWCVALGALGSERVQPAAAAALNGAGITMGAVKLAVGVGVVAALSWLVLGLARGEPSVVARAGAVPVMEGAMTPAAAESELAPEVARVALEADSMDDAAARAPESDPCARIEILLPDGRPAGGARAVLVGAKGHVDDARADEAGRVEFEPRASRSMLLVTHDGYLPHAASITAGAGDQCVVLPVGVELSGQARYTDGRPASGLELELESDRAVFAGVELSLRRWQELELEGHASTRVARDGSFRFEGLPPDWSGDLLLPQGVRERADESQPSTEACALRLDAPRSDLALELRRGARLSGRVVDSEGRPMPEVELALFVSYGSWVTKQHPTVTDESGRFEIALLERDVRRLRLSMRTSSGGVQQWAEFAPDEHTEADIELGELVFETRSERGGLVVVNEEGAPIEGAWLLTGGGTRSDEHGRLELVGLRAGASSVIVTASEYAPQQVGLMTLATEPVVELARASVLELRLPTGFSERHLQIELQHDELLFPRVGGPQSEWTLGSSQQHLLSFHHTLREGEVRTSFKLPEDACLLLDALRPGVPFVARLLDTRQEVCGEVQIGALAAGERRRVELLPDERLGELRGRITDDSGRALAGAGVTLGFGNHGVHWVESDPAGRFELPCATRELDSVRVSRTGYATRVVPVADPDAELSIALERGRDLRVLVLDEAGAPVASTSLVVRLGDTPLPGGATTDAQGWIELAGLPVSESFLSLESPRGNASLFLAPETAEARAVLRAP